MPREMDLGGAWEIIPVARFDGNYDAVGAWHKVTVPGHWQQLPELETHTGKVVYRKAFKFRPETEKRLFLKLHGVFYWATAYLNGMRLGANEGYFFPAEYEISGMLRKDNILLIECDCPREDDKTYKRQLTGVFHHWDCIDPATNPGGVWLPAEIVSTGPARILDPLFTTAYLGKDNSSARITGQATIETKGEARLTVRISFIPRTFAGETQIFEREAHKSAGSHTYHYHLDLKAPTLWWTHDHGRPELYTLKFEVFTAGANEPSDVWETAFGVRTFEMREYIAYLNGRRMFIRGNNYPPGDTRLATMTKERCQQDLKLAAECNLNFLRVHAHVDHPAFYEAADEAGVLLWQDFPMQWYYRPEAGAQAMRQLERMIFHLGNHPAVGVWCMHNEPFRAFDLRERYRPGSLTKALCTFLFPNANRDRLDPAMAQRARFLDPTRFVTQSSGERGLFKKPGDGHFYFGWYFGPMHWFHGKYVKHPEQLRFVTEFGSQSAPNAGNAARFMGGSLAAVDWKKMKARHHYQGFFMDRFAPPKKFPDLASWAQATQDYQSELNRYHVDRLRALKYKPAGGVVPFILLDSNPAIQWSVIDYWRDPKSSYYALQKAMSPVYAFIIMDRPGYKRGDVAALPVYAVNDTWEDVEVKVTLTVTSPVGDDILTETCERRLPGDSEALVLANPRIKLRWAGDYRASLTLTGPSGRLEHEYRIKVR